MLIYVVYLLLYEFNGRSWSYNLNMHWIPVEANKFFDNENNRPLIVLHVP